ncbi:hypothetical protein BST37_05075 [Mycobacterium noviomagense]|uniref:Uncharacterized protein n=1 Tax=Mycobacterium noviomagense TaxID=459858 RepID=A0ABX3T8V9_9MYCO|nr:hypothetical protein BST37_05075 [Mycobacterium noviomagense]
MHNKIATPGLGEAHAGSDHAWLAKVAGGTATATTTTCVFEVTSHAFEDVNYVAKTAISNL